MVSSTRYYLHFKKGGGRGVAFGKAAEHDGAVELAPELDLMLKGEALSDFVTETGESGGWTCAAQGWKCASRMCASPTPPPKAESTR